MAPLAASLAGLGGALKGYNEEYDQSLKQAGDIAFGRTLQMLSGNPGNVGMGQPPQMSAQQGQQSLPTAPQGGPQAGGMAGGTPGMAPGGGAPGGPMQLGAGPSGAPPPMNLRAPQQQLGVPQQGGALDWRQVLFAVQRANPGAPPQVLAAAVEKAIPLMNSQSQMEWRNFIMPQLAQQRIAATERGQDITARGQDVRAATAAGAQETARRGQDVRAQTATDNRISRETIAQAGINGRQAMFEAGLISREQMDAANREERAREADQRATTSAAAEAGRERRAELSDATKKEISNLSLRARKEIEAARLKVEGIKEEGRNVRARAGEETRMLIERDRTAAADERAAAAEAGRQSRAELSSDTRKEIAGMSVEARKELTELLERGRAERAAQSAASRASVAAANRQERAREADQSREERARQFGIREHRLQAAAVIRQDQQWQHLDIQRRNLERQIREGGQRQFIAQWRTILDAQHKRAIEIIQSNSMMNIMDDKTRKQLLDDSNSAYEKAIRDISGAGQSSP